MRSRLGRTFADWWGPATASSGRRGRPLDLTLEVLEPRLLMARSVGSVVARALVTVPSVSPVLRDSPSFAGKAGIEAAEYGASPDLTDLAPPLPGPYWIVPETTSLHSTLRTAQPIPDVPYAGVLGRIGIGDPIDLYRVAVGPGSLFLRLGSTSSGPSSPSLSLAVFDALGRLLADGTQVGGQVDVTLDPEKIGLLPGSALFVGVASVGPNLPGSVSGYQLWFLRLSGADADGATTELISSPTPTALGPTPALNLASPVPLVSTARPIAPDLMTAPPTLVASAQLPTLSAAPSGGVMADDAPAVAVALRATLGPVPAPRAAAQSSELEPSNFPLRGEGPGQERDGPPVVGLRAPGGFPLLVASAVGDWRPGSATAQYPEWAPGGSCSARHPASARSLLGPPTQDGFQPLTIPGPPLPARSKRGDDLPRRPALDLAAAGTLYVLFTDRTAVDDLANLSKPPADPRRRGNRRRPRGPDSV